MLSGKELAWAREFFGSGHLPSRCYLRSELENHPFIDDLQYIRALFHGFRSYVSKCYWNDTAEIGQWLVTVHILCSYDAR